jgi:hypothetical protein
MKMVWRSTVVLLPVMLLGGCAAHHTTAPPKPPSVAKEGGSSSVPAFGPAKIDEALRAEWTRAGVVPSRRADDATFLRRVYVDLVGTVPLPEETAAFLADVAPDKRTKLVERLLASPEYADHWMNYWDDVLMGKTTPLNLVDRGAFRDWLRAKFATNARWDAVVRELVTATGQNSHGGRKVKGPAMAIPVGASGTGGDEEADEEDIRPINGAVNWTLRFEQTPLDLGGNASRVFLGVQIQCAQCHDHKTESWKQDDFRRFTSALFRSKVESIEPGKQKGTIRRVKLVDAPVPPPRFTKNAEFGPVARAKPTALDGTSLDKGEDTRRSLATWMTAKENPWFARAFVNRMWGHFLGRGFYDPVDDIRPSNPPAAGALLDKIAADFAAHDFDVRYLLRTICATEAYQLAAERDPKSSADPDNTLWAHFHLVPLGPEELLNAILRVTDLEKTAQKAGIKDLDALRASIVKQYAFLFDTDEEDDEPDYSGTVSQALALLNGGLVAHGSRAYPNASLFQVVNGPGSDAEKVDQLVTRIFARKPTPEERERWVGYVGQAGQPKTWGGGAKAGPPTPRGARSPLDRLGGKRSLLTAKQAAYEDLVWSFLNSSEFSFNH